MIRNTRSGRLRILILGAMCTLALGLASTPAFAAVQTVTSSEGRYAWGLGGSRLSDDSYLEYGAYFSRAEGVKAGGPALGGADLHKPVGSLAITEVREVSNPGPNQPAREYRPVCNSLQNVTSYDAGRRTTMDMGVWGAHKPVWTGLWFDVKCDGALGYDFFRVHVDATPPNGLLEAAAVDTERPVTVNNDVDYVVSEEAVQAVGYGEADRWYSSATGYKQHLPEFTPVSAPWVWVGVRSDASQTQDLYAVSQTWNAGSGYDPATGGRIGWFGYTAGQPMLRQMAALSLCGYRDGQEVRCYYGGGFGDIFPSVVGMTQTLHSPDAQ